MDWRVEFGNLTRKEIPEIPLDAIREAITNSFGHKMFDSGQSIEITIFKNRIEIYNPGAFPTNKTPDDGFVVVFYRHGTRKLSGIAQKTAQKEKTAQKPLKRKK